MERRHQLLLQGRRQESHGDDFSRSEARPRGSGDQRRGSPRHRPAPALPHRQAQRRCLQLGRRLAPYHRDRTLRSRKGRSEAQRRHHRLLHHPQLDRHRRGDTRLGQYGRNQSGFRQVEHHRSVYRGDDRRKQSFGRHCHRERFRILAGFLGQGRCGGFQPLHRSARQGAGTPGSAFAIPSRHELRRNHTSAGDGTDIQFMVRQVPSRDDLVASGAVRPLRPRRPSRPYAPLV